MMNDHTFRFKINPVEESVGNDEDDPKEIPRWEVPEDLMGNIKDDYGMRLNWANFDVSEDPAGFELSNPLKPDIKYLSTKGRNFVFSDKYLELGFLVESRNIYGFGERSRTLELTPGNYSDWANGRDNNYDPGELGHNSYGDHPFVLARLKDNTFVGIFWLNSNAKALEYTHAGDHSSILNFRSIGGVMDFYAFYAENAEDVIKAYHGVIGNAHLPPFWALGFQQSSWQYNSTKRVDEVRKGYKDANLPLEVMWLDIEYMKDYKNFEVDTDRFENLPGLSRRLHDDQQRLVTIVDAGFKLDKDYSYYTSANKTGLFIKSVQNPDKHNGNIIGRVWPGLSAFIDFAHPNSTDWWVDALTGKF